MGLFSIYTGLMYNDIFSKTLHFWDSGWTFPESSDSTIIGVDNGHRYPFGLDPGWHGTVNGLVFTNSYKMKMSIVLGVTHVRNFYESHIRNLIPTCYLLDDIRIMPSGSESYQVQAPT